jgi:hypothetical protein
MIYNSRDLKKKHDGAEVWQMLARKVITLKKQKFISKKKITDKTPN